MQEEDGLQEVDSRTLREYLRDVGVIELRGLYPEYSTKRKWILSYWYKALEDGKVRFDGTGGEILNNTELRKVYLGG
jgi:ABC-type branched-subunit amino acid transport system ATPase component